MEQQRYCVQCGQNLAPNGRFCARCGTPVASIGAAPAEEPRAVTSVQTNNLTDSDVVYLHGDLFAGQGSWRKAEITLESSGRKVQKEELANRLILAAAASLAKEGWIQLATVNVGFMIRSDSHVFRPVSSAPYPRGGLEGAIFATLQNGDKANSVERVVVRLVGGEKGDPWGEIIDRVRAHLAATGYLIKSENSAAHGFGKLFRSPYVYQANASLIGRTAAEAARVQSNLAEVQYRDPHTWEQVTKKVRKALTSCLPSADTSDTYD